MMTKKQRLLRAARCEEPDRVPIAPSIWHLLRRWYGNCFWPFEIQAGLEYDFDPMPHLTWFDGPPFHNNVRILNGSYIFEGRAYFEDIAPGVTIDVHVERHNEYTLVSRRIKTPAGEIGDALRQPRPQGNFGMGNFKTSGWVPPEHLEPLIKGPEDLKRVKFLLTMPGKGELAKIKAISGLIGENGLVEIDCLSPVDYLANQAIPLKELQSLYASNRSFFNDVISLFWDYSFKRTKLYLEAGAEAVLGIWYDCGPSDGWTIEVWRQVFLPLLKQHVALAHGHGALYEYNEEGKVRELLPLFKEAGIDILRTVAPVPEGDINLKEAKQQVGSSICLHGYIDSVNVLEKGNPKQIDEAVREAIMTAAPGGGFIIGTTRPITVNTPEENIRAYFDACHKYGNYKCLP